MKIKYISIIWVNEKIKEYYQSWAAIQNLLPHIEVGKEYDYRYLLELAGWKYTQKQEGIFYDYWMRRKKLLLKNILKYTEIDQNNKIVKILNPSKPKAESLKIERIDPYNYLDFEVPNKRNINKELKRLGFRKGNANELSKGDYIIIIDKLLVYFMWDKKYKASINLKNYIIEVFNEDYKHIKLNGLDCNFFSVKTIENLREICKGLIEFY